MKKGFTIVELLLIIVIIGVIAAVVIIAISKMLDRTPENEKQYCESVSWMSMKDIPVKCLKYYEIN